MLEKVRQNKIIKGVCDFGRTPWYIAIIAAVVFLSHVFGLEYIAFWTVGITASFMLVMSDDATPIVPCVMLAMFCISKENGAKHDHSAGILTTTAFFVNAGIIVALFAAAIIFHIVYYKKYSYFKKKTMLAWGFIALSLGFVTNGFFYKDYNFLNLPYGLSFAVLYYGVYLVFFHLIKWKKGFSMRYLAFTLFAMGLVIAAEIGVLWLQNEELRQTGNKSLVWLGWGLSNAIAYVFMLTMPFAFYLAHTEKFSLPYFMGASAMLVAVIFTFSRGSLIVALPMYVAGTIFSCLFARNKLPLWISAGIIFAISVVVIVCYREQLYNVLNFYIERGLNDSGRFELWKEGWEAFLSAPVFGVGMFYRFGEVLTSFTWFHNTIIHFLATGGIVGLGSYIFHRVQTVVMYCKKPSVDRLFAGFAILCLLANSMLDVAMSIQNMVMFYGIILAFSEKDLLYHCGKIDANGEEITDPQKQLEAAAAARNGLIFGEGKKVKNVMLSSPSSEVFSPASESAATVNGELDKSFAETISPEKVKQPPLNDKSTKKNIQKSADSVKKARVLFPAVEAGLGHIMPMESVRKVFEEKYGDRVETVATSFYKDAESEAMRKLERLFVSTVNMQNKVRGYGKLSCLAMSLFGHISLKAIMESFVRESYPDGLKRMTEFDADLVFSTHWATAYYAARIDKKPINVQYCPDTRIDVLWDTGADVTFCPSKAAIERARSKTAFEGVNFNYSPFVIRSSAFETSRDKAELRKELGLWQDCPTVTLADGGYGAGRLGKTVRELLKSERRLNIVAICGKNVKLHEKLGQEVVPENINFKNLSFTNDMIKYIAAADIFMGKSGASSMAEPRFFGVPMIVTMFATPIERDNARFYIEEVGCAEKHFNVKKAVARAYELLDNPDEYNRLKENALKGSESNGAEYVADMLYEILVNNFETDGNGNVTRRRIG
ncbi:MAG: hypothetical protein HFK09_04645 [Clostridia bacterium]|nr:hypothetical protein [Clostridia bacterium]